MRGVDKMVFSSLEVSKQRVSEYVVKDEDIVRRAANLFLQKNATMDIVVNKIVQEGKKAGVSDANVRSIIQINLIDTNLIGATGSVLSKDGLRKLGGNEFRLALKAAGAAIKDAAVVSKDAAVAQTRAIGAGIKVGAVGVKAVAIPAWKLTKKAGKPVVGAAVIGLAVKEGYDLFAGDNKAKSMGPTVQPVTPVQKSFQEEITNYIKDNVKPSEQQSFINNFSKYEGQYTINQVKNWVDETLESQPKYRK